MRGICGLRSHAGICHSGPKTGQEVPTVREASRVDSVSSEQNKKREWATVPTVLDGKTILIDDGAFICLG